MSVPEYLLMSLLVALAFIVYRGRQRYFSGHRESYHKLLVGLASWLMIFMCKALAESNFFGAVAGNDGPILQSALQAFFLVAGGLFNAIALVEWLPKLAAADYRARRLKEQLRLLRVVAAARLRITDSHELALEVKRLLAEFIDQAQIEVCCFDKTSHTLTPEQRPQTEVGRETTLHQHCRESIKENVLRVSPTGLDRDHRPLAILPIAAESRKVYLLLICWPLEHHLEQDTEQLLQLLHSQLQQVATTEDRESHAAAALTETFADLRGQIAGAERLSDEVLTIDAALGELISHDVLRIAVFDERGLNVTQYAVGSGKNLLTERDKSISTSSTRLAAMFAEGRVTSCADLSASEFVDDRWLAQCGARRAVSIPLLAADRVLAVVSLAAAEADLSLGTDNEFVRKLTDSLLPLIQTDLLNQQSIAFNRRVLDLTAALKQVVESGGGEAALGTIADIIVRQFPASYARLWSYDPAADSLRLLAATEAHPSEIEVKLGHEIPAAAASWHRQAITSGKLTIFSPADPEHTLTVEEERLALLSDTKSALFVPLVSEEQTLGVLTVAEVRNPERRQFSLAETIFARGMASIATLALLSGKRQPNQSGSRLQLHERTRELSPMLAQLFKLPQRLATPLTSILARSQQLLGSEVAQDKESRRNLQIINQQAERIIKEIRTVQEARQEQVLS